jgi:hypothetical protein
LLLGEAGVKDTTAGGDIGVGENAGGAGGGERTTTLDACGGCAKGLPTGSRGVCDGELISRCCGCVVAAGLL